jgi:hypothetical protein
MPPIVAIHQTPSLTQEKYEEVVSRLTSGERRFESSADVPFEGLVVHATAQTEDGFLVFDASALRRPSTGSTRRCARSRERSEFKSRRSSIPLTHSFSNDRRANEQRFRRAVVTDEPVDEPEGEAAALIEEL